MSKPDYELEQLAIFRGATSVVGVDEVGRGPLAGPVMAAAVVLSPDRIPEGLNDSKKLGVKRRESLYEQILEVADVGFGEATVEEIDQINILQASLLAMRRAVHDLKSPADYALVDGKFIPKGLNIPAEGVVKGDAKSVSISAASIVAKIRRDRLMESLAQQFPGYGWERNAGYPTVEHREALKNLGVTPHHRRSFAPVHNILYQEKNITS
ncbi:ribonuclease HII [Cognatishimia activa]|uniref:Ribonuclease HII n=1 Tax=Cognatishimia activa TaxID=1715691 RepID=A0A0P1ILD8_9RHOB|nr:ribonuclease HII [Cognatishimia activa]CUI57478.1 Ribonuclease HII [Cognatishimia activa]CUK24422.1 Ribonuclease HII [Cognatishimia activa]